MKLQIDLVHPLHSGSMDNAWTIFKRSGCTDLWCVECKLHVFEGEEFSRLD